MLTSTMSTRGSIAKISSTNTSHLCSGETSTGLKRECLLEVADGSGVASGPHSVEALLKELYKANPEAVINGESISMVKLTLVDRFGNTHFDFRTVEYGLGEAPSDETMWQFTRGCERFSHICAVLP